jgi:uncharacterized Zn finger protein
MAWYRYFAPSRPRRTRGGIRAQSKRGAIGETWWARKWVEVLESFDIGARLARGRSYARHGQVLSIDVGKGNVKARVQGSRPAPYQVEIKIKSLTAAQWQGVAKEFARQAVFGAKLLAGEMPQDAEKAFKAAGVSLFPARHADLTTECSCPDWSNPCKHVAAVYYLLGEEFDRDPFLLLTLRGMERTKFVELMGRGAPARKAPRGAAAKAAADEPEAAAKSAPQALPADPEAFWGTRAAAPGPGPAAGNGPDAEGWGEVRVPSAHAALVRRLGSFPFWRGEEKFLDVMQRVYAAASPAGLDVFLGERQAEEVMR